MKKQRRVPVSLLGALVLASCAGQIDDTPGAEEGSAPPGGGVPGNAGDTVSKGAPGTPGAPGAPGTPASPEAGSLLPPAVSIPKSCQTPAGGPSPLRRLTRVEYLNTLRDLLGTADVPAVVLAPDSVALGFDNIASVQSVSQLLAEQYETAAATVAADAVRTLPALLKCDVAAMGEDPCVRRFIADFGLRAYRRPVTPAEAMQLFALYAGLKPKQGFSGAIETLLQGILMSPQLLYRLEVSGSAPRGAGPFEKLTPYEMATRLSYFLWASLPDEALFAAAAANQLETPAQIAAQVGRMLADPRARAAVGRFYQQWLDLGGLESVGKDSKAYPTFKPNLLDLWKRETVTFVDDVLFKGDAKLKTLFTADYTFANKSLADFYKFTGPTSEAQFDRVGLDANRLGLLTQASFLARRANPDQSSPVKRGVFVLESLFCVDVPSPPANIEVKAPQVQPGQSTRERFAIHTESPVCGGCHKLMDPIGFALENFDGIGRYRTMDQGRAVDANAAIAGTDVDGAFTGALELARRVGRSEQVGACVVTNWFRFTHGREETPQDTCALETLKEQMKVTGGDLKRLIVALTQSQVFLNKTGGTP